MIRCTFCPVGNMASEIMNAPQLFQLHGRSCPLGQVQVRTFRIFKPERHSKISKGECQHPERVGNMSPAPKSVERGHATSMASQETSDPSNFPDTDFVMLRNALVLL